MDWLNDNSGAVQAISTIVLILITAFSMRLTLAAVRAAERQANASDAMSAEARLSRLDEYRPVLTLRSLTQEEFGTGRVALEQAFSQLWNDTHVWCRLVNIGRGPALNIRASLLALDDQPRIAELGTLSLGETQKPHRFAINHGAIEVSYEDVFGRRPRTVTIDESGPSVGDLTTGMEDETS